jgi:hypothetical protein
MSATPKKKMSSAASVLVSASLGPRIVASMGHLARPANFLGHFTRSMAFLCCLGVAVCAAPSAPLLMAQQQAQRVVQGKVVDGSGAGIKGATVFLKDSHTLAIKSYIASDDGSFRFGQLTQTVDYQLWAEIDGKKSSVKNISSFDTRKEFNIPLKIDTGK